MDFSFAMGNMFLPLLPMYAIKMQVFMPLTLVQELCLDISFYINVCKQGTLLLQVSHPLTGAIVKVINVVDFHCQWL